MARLWNKWATLRLMLAGAVALLLWTPHVSHYHFDRSPAAPGTVRALVQRPADAVLSEIAAMPTATAIDGPGDDPVRIADEILSGRLVSSRFAKPPVTIRGYPADLSQSSPTFELCVASLEIERVLLVAYEKTRDERYLLRATSRIVQFAEYERSCRLPYAFLWNDHAVAARIPLLARFWRHARNHSRVTEAQQEAVVSLVQRSGRLLAKPSHFTVRTNHGVMQNIALLQVAAAFDALPEARAWCALAMERLALQLPYYVSPEGVVLEHSAQYQALGVQLADYALRLAALNNVEPPAPLASAASNARHVLALLMRPDGSLPLLGDTHLDVVPAVSQDPALGAAPLAPAVLPLPAVRRGTWWFPISGYAVWWSDDGPPHSATQTVIAWSLHDGHGHKHADETSVHYWSDKVNWITATGYWPNGLPGEEMVSGWAGSNAPHLMGEPAGSSRSTKLVAIGDDGGLRFSETLREGPDALEIRRQVVQVDAATLAVLDFVSGASAPIETVWTVDPGLRLDSGGGSTFRSSVSSGGRCLHAGTLGTPTGHAAVTRGAMEPFGGWVAARGGPLPAYAIRVVQPGQASVRIMVFTLRPDAEPYEMRPRAAEGASPTSWRVEWSGGASPVAIERAGQLLLAESGTSTRRCGLRVPQDEPEARSRLRRAFLEATSTYPAWRDLAKYRARLTYVTLILWLALELAGRAWAGRLGMNGRWNLLVVLPWIGFAAWAHWLYLV